MKDCEVIKTLPVEDRAKMDKKEIPCGVVLSIFIIGLCLGLYYWVGGAFIFNYRTISPFWGFVIFFVGGIVIDIIISLMYSIYWDEYNDLIKQANNELSVLIKKGEGSPEELFRLKKELIERKIGKELLSQEEFLWHSNKYCWGCGKKHTQPPKRYDVHKERTESWRDGAFRYTKTFSKDGYIDICPDCYSRLVNAKQQDEKNTPWIIATTVILGSGVVIGANFLWGSDGLWISIFAILLFGGWAILAMLSYLILYPFLKQGDTRTKWSFDEIPVIRKFMNQNLPHTH